MVHRWDCTTTYCSGHVAWFGEFPYILAEEGELGIKDACGQYVTTTIHSTNESPADSYKWHKAWKNSEGKYHLPINFK